VESFSTVTINKTLPHIFFLLWVGQIASSECYAQDLPADSAIKVLQERIERRFDVLDELRKDASFVESIGKSLKHGERDGAMTYAILLVDTKDGKMAIKIYKPEHREEDLAMSLVLNQYLGELGLAPKLYGYVPREQTAKILSEKLGRDSTDGSFSFAILMEVIDGAWQFKRDNYVPQELKTWDLTALVERIMFFQRTLDALRIKANDIQYLISRSGEIYLIDCDHFNWISPQNELWGYSAPFTIQKEDFARLQARYGDSPIPVKNDFLFDIEYLQRIFAENQ
jgi:hypothetical protein